MQEYINRRTVQKFCFVRGHIAMLNAQQKGKFVKNAENQIILPKFVNLLLLMLLIMKMRILFEYNNSCDIPSSKTSMHNSKVHLLKFIANIKIDNVKVKFLIDT